MMSPHSLGYMAALRISKGGIKPPADLSAHVHDTHIAHGNPSFSDDNEIYEKILL